MYWLINFFLYHFKKFWILAVRWNIHICFIIIALYHYSFQTNVHCETNKYCTAYDRFIILLNNNSVTSQHFHDDQIAIVELLENLQLCSCIVPFKSKLTVRCESRFSTRFTILNSCVNRESRIKNNLSRIKSTIESHGTKNKRFTHHWFLDNFTKTYGCNTTQHGYSCISNSRERLLLKTRPIQVKKGMFLQGHLYHASFLK